MCLATPAQILSITEETARVDLNGIKFDVNVSFIDEPKINDWVIVHAGVALSKVDDDYLNFWNQGGYHELP